MGWFFDRLAATATSYVVAGNSGVSSFLTLLLVGSIERYDENLLKMDPTVEAVLSSTPSLVVLSLLTIAEVVAMCVPVVDEITDAAMTAVVPIVSLLGTLGTLGLYDGDATVDVVGDDEDRRLEGVAGSDLAINVWRAFVVVTGIGLASTMHLFKMLVRLIGVGWLTGCLTVVETLWCVTTVLAAVFVRTTAVVFATVILGAVGWHWRRRLTRSQREREEEEASRRRQLASKRRGGGDDEEEERSGEETSTTPDEENGVGSPSTKYQRMD